jgi:biotin carboxyl carrier protein
MSEQDTTFTETKLTAQTAARMGADELLAALRELRHNPRGPDYWTTLCVCMAALCRAQSAVVVQSRDGLQWTPLATSASPPSWLEEMGVWVAEMGDRAMKQGHAFQPHSHLGYVCLVRLLEDGVATLLVMAIPASERANLSELMLRAQLVSDLPRQGSGVSAVTSDTALLDLLDLNAKVMQESSFGAAALTLVNGLASRGDFEQVALGWLEPSGYVRVQAISHLDRFERKMENIVLLEAAMEEALDQHSDVYYPNPDGAGLVTLAHERLQRVLGQRQIATLVLGQGAQDGPAVLMLIRPEPAFVPAALAELSVVLHLLLPWLEQSKNHSRPWWVRARDVSRLTVKRWFSPEHPAKKAISVVVGMVLAFLVFGSWPHRIEAGMELVTDSTQIISSPFDGYLASVEVTLGDTVLKDQSLASLDTRDVVLQASDYQSEATRFMAEADRARALNQAAETEIALARAQQAQAKYDRAIFQLRQAKLQAPFSGVIVEGERKELTGMPVRQGDQVLKLARIEGLYGVLSVSERDIHFVPEKARGVIRLLSAPDQLIPFEMETLVPTAQVRGEAGNQFLIKVKLLQDPKPWWRPGMSGLALIEGGDRNVLWLMTHKLVDTIRLMLWF